MKPEISHKKKNARSYKKVKVTQHATEQWVIEEIKGEILKYLEKNANRNMTYQNL